MRCRHRFAMTIMRHIKVPAHDDASSKTHAVTMRQCEDCFAWLPLGKANDEPEAVRVEMRAAEMAASAMDGDLLTGLCNGAEIAGWIEAIYDSQKVPEQPGEWSGWLAHYIHDHDATHSHDTGDET
jgi:hypothetical protein